MKARRYCRTLAASLVLAMFTSATFAIPQPSPKKQNFRPRKRQVTVARLKEEFGKPKYHLKYGEEINETLVDENHKKLGTIYYDEEIAFEIKDYLVVYYFSKGKFLARVIKGERKASRATDHSGPEAKEAK